MCGGWFSPLCAQKATLEINQEFGLHPKTDKTFVRPGKSSGGRSLRKATEALSNLTPMEPAMRRTTGKAAKLADLMLPKCRRHSKFISG